MQVTTTGGTSGQLTYTYTNSAPVAVDKEYNGVQRETLSVPAPGIIAGDTDADDDSFRHEQIDLGGLPGHNTSISSHFSGSFSIDLVPGFFGLGSFIYVTRDFYGAVSNRATVSVFRDFGTIDGLS